MSRRETMYFLSSPATDSAENFTEDAERRARERGCSCPSPLFVHLLAPWPGTCTTIVNHGPWCPLAGVAS